MKENTSDLFGYVPEIHPPGQYLPVLTVVENRKGVLDVDTVKGCALGMQHYPEGGLLW
jgi:hypothetical protein